MAAVGAFTYVEALDAGWPTWAAVVIGILVTALLGALVQLLIMRPLRNASPLTRLVATLGVLTALQGGLTIRYGGAERFVKSFLPTGTWSPAHHISVGVDRLWLLGIAAALSGGLWLLYRYTRFGLTTRAVAENQEVAAALGRSPDVIATINWALGAALAGLAGILVVPIIGLSVDQVSLLLIPALAAALVGSFSSFPLTLVGGVVIGIIESELLSSAAWIPSFLKAPGWSESVPFIVIIAVLVIRGRALPLRSYVLERRPVLGTGRVRPIPILCVLAATFVALNGIGILGYGGVHPNWISSATTTMIAATICLSLVVVTGYAGQLSLAQYALAGVGAYIAAQLAGGGQIVQLFSLGHVSFEVALVLGILGAIPVGVLVGLPALRTRGVNLAIATLGLALIIERVVLSNPDYTGGFQGTKVRPPNLFGLSLDPIRYPGRYATFCVALFTLAALAVANLRRGRAGRRLIAVRANERAAASLGISVVGAKLYAFGLAAAIAGLGGILLAFRTPAVVYSSFDLLNSIQVVVQTVIGGVGLIGGAVFGGAIAVGGAISYMAGQLLGVSDEWIILISGLVLIADVILFPNGIVRRIAYDVGRLFNLLGSLLSRPLPAPEMPDVPREPITPATLRVSDIRVQFGGIVAVDGASLEVRPGEVVGLIGPNGAGKTTLIDVITGFTRCQEGHVLLDDTPIDRWSARRRARAGIARSFQSLELFEDMTVRDNLRTASDRRDPLAYLTDLLWPGNPPLHSTAVAAVREFGFTEDLERRPGELPYGRRRLIGIARAIATQPSVLLLDEPAAGLDEEESAELGGLVRRLASEWNLAILLVEHNVPLVMSVCDRVVALDFGRVIAHGSPDEVGTDASVIGAYLGEPGKEDDDQAAAPVTKPTPAGLSGVPKSS
jgi:ABC-type branched-subunit amino acid transport system ATPase component/ABC-type branched-subunit amino acid transport system permease subunit